MLHIDFTAFILVLPDSKGKKCSNRVEWFRFVKLLGGNWEISFVHLVCMDQKAML